MKGGHHRCSISIWSDGLYHRPIVHTSAFFFGGGRCRSAFFLASINITYCRSLLDVGKKHLCGSEQIQVYTIPHNGCPRSTRTSSRIGPQIVPMANLASLAVFEKIVVFLSLKDRSSLARTCRGLVSASRRYEETLFRRLKLACDIGVRYFERPNRPRIRRGHRERQSPSGSDASVGNKAAQRREAPGSGVDVRLWHRHPSLGPETKSEIIFTVWWKRHELDNFRTGVR